MAGIKIERLCSAASFCISYTIFMAKTEEDDNSFGSFGTGFNTGVIGVIVMMIIGYLIYSFIGYIGWVNEGVQTAKTYEYRRYSVPDEFECDEIKEDIVEKKEQIIISYTDSEPKKHEQTRIKHTFRNCR